MFNSMHRAALMLGLLLFGATAAAEDFSGSYEVVTPPQPTLTQSKIEVMEVFWYGCPHCHSLEPYLEKWLATKPDNVEFVRLPGVLNQSWVPHARAFYTAQKLGVMDKIHKPLFDALHKDKKPIYTEDALREFFIEQGVDGDAFDKVYRSNEIDTRVKQALVMARNYKLTGVPALIVNGKYMTSGSLAHSFDNLLKTVDYLVGLESAAVPAQ